MSAAASSSALPEPLKVESDAIATITVPRLLQQGEKGPVSATLTQSMSIIIQYPRQELAGTT